MVLVLVVLAAGFLLRAVVSSLVAAKCLRIRPERDIGIGPLEPRAAQHADWLDAHLNPHALELWEHAFVLGPLGVPSWELRWRSADRRHQVAVRIPTAPGGYDASLLSRREDDVWVLTEFPHPFKAEERMGWVERCSNAPSLAEAFEEHRAFVGDATVVDAWPSLEERTRDSLRNDPRGRVTTVGNDEFAMTWRGVGMLLTHSFTSPHTEWLAGAPLPLEHFEDTLLPTTPAVVWLRVADALCIAGIATATAIAALSAEGAWPLLVVLGAHELVQWGATRVLLGHGHRHGMLLPWPLSAAFDVRSVRISAAPLVGPWVLLLVDKLQLPSRFVDEVGGRIELMSLLTATVALLPSRWLIGGRLLEAVLGPTPYVALAFELLATLVLTLLAALVGPWSLVLLAAWIGVLAIPLWNEDRTASSSWQEVRVPLETRPVVERPAVALAYARNLAGGTKAHRIGDRWLRWSQPMPATARLVLGAVYVGGLALAWRDLGPVLFELACGRWPFLADVVAQLP